MSNPDQAEIARLDGELAKLRLQLFRAFYAGAVWCDQHGFPLRSDPEVKMEPGFQEWLASRISYLDGPDLPGLPECVHIGKRVLEQLQSRAWVDRITALLALPATAIGDDIAKAVEICVRRYETLELERLK
jgi:hypothetical protein